MSEPAASAGTVVLTVTFEEDSHGTVKVTTNEVNDEKPEETVIAPESLDHKVEKVEAKAPTCTENGNIEYYECTVCGKLYTAEDHEEEIAAEDVVLEATGHDWSIVSYRWAYDYSSAQAVITCANDESHIRTVDLEVTYTISDGVITYTAYAEEDGEIYRSVRTALQTPDISTAYFEYYRKLQAQKAAEAAAAEIKPVETTEPVIPAIVNDLPFVDVNVTDSFYDDVKYVYDNGIMNGMSDKEFAPDSTLTRAMIVTILYRVEGEPEVAFAGVFNDVEDELWYSEAIEWAAANGIVNGYGNGKFGPNDPVTREQLAAILYRYANFKGYDVSSGENTNILSYDDSFDISDWAAAAMQWAISIDVLNSGDTAAIRPTESAKRSEIAHAIHAFLVSVSE